MMALSSLLVDAVSFLFGEGKKFLQERRARKEAAKNVAKGESETAGKPPLEHPQLGEMITSKEDALQQKISQTQWINSEAKVKHLMELLRVYTKNYYLAKEQYAKWGSALVPPIIVNNLSEAENSVAETINSLEEELGKVYGKKIVVPEV
jgi:hypothetical protein